ncbi:hypothetical protein K1719_012544 [Acacia pycnantha]|nr:hypothetical protein K1719_012544 [Acacia pycnantha]
MKENLKLNSSLRQRREAKSGEEEDRDVNISTSPIVRCSATAYLQKDPMSSVDDNKEQGQMDVNTSNESMPSTKEQEEVMKKKYGGLLPKKQPLISKDHERAYFDSADWALGKQGGEKPKGPLEALRPKLQPTQQQTRYRKSFCSPSGEEGASVPSEDAPSNE